MSNNNCDYYEDPAIIFASAAVKNNDADSRQRPDLSECDVTLSTSGEHESRPSSERPAEYNEDANSTVSEILDLLSSCEGQSMQKEPELCALSLLKKPHPENIYQRSKKLSAP